MKRIIFTIFLMAIGSLFFTSIFLAEPRKYEVKSVFVAGYFNSGNFQLTKEIRNQLRQFAGMIPVSGSVITLEGYADKSGSPAKNQKLALKRADEVEKWLKRLRPDIVIATKKGVIYDTATGQLVNSRIARLKILVPAGTQVDSRAIITAVGKNLQVLADRQAFVQQRQNQALAGLTQSVQDLGKKKFQVNVQAEDYSSSFHHVWKLQIATVILLGLGVLFLAILILGKNKDSVILKYQDEDSEFAPKIQLTSPKNEDFPDRGKEEKVILTRKAVLDKGGKVRIMKEATWRKEEKRKVFS